jgi:hypothetical protein
MADIEMGVLNRQCLSQYIESKERMISEVGAWQQQRNSAEATVDWQFTSTDARIRLKTLYPVIQVLQTTRFFHDLIVRVTCTGLPYYAALIIKKFRRHPSRMRLQQNGEAKKFGS